jgi:hypothetical protein
MLVKAIVFQSQARPKVVHFEPSEVIIDSYLSELAVKEAPGKPSRQRTLFRSFLVFFILVFPIANKRQAGYEQPHTVKASRHTLPRQKKNSSPSGPLGSP